MSGTPYPPTKEPDQVPRAHLGSYRGEGDELQVEERNLEVDPITKPTIRAQGKPIFHKGLTKSPSHTHSPKKLSNIESSSLGHQGFLAPSFNNQSAIDTLDSKSKEGDEIVGSKSGNTEKNNSPAKSKSGSGRQARQLFEESKRQLAETFLKQLDDTIAGGQLSILAEPTGGIKLNWTNKLSTTAGRANWRKERVQVTAGPEIKVRYKHHASIDLAEKIIDDNHRLLNVIAHEFCHLANFMIGGITDSPHGKEFKIWAAKCSQAFSDRGIKVTTKHSYEIDFKYVWKCAGCGLEYKRHSKSINPERHRCGSCKSLLQQIKPAPRTRGGLSQYQLFVREQMSMMRHEHPGTTQQEMMRIVADRWALQAPRRTGNAHGDEPGDPTVACITTQIHALEL